LALFTLAGVEPRYVASFVVLLMLAALSVIRVRPRPWARAAVLMVALLAAVSLSRPLATRAISPYPAAGHARTSLEVAKGLAALGVKPGDRVAVVRPAASVYWAQLADVQIIAEITVSQTPPFWDSPESQRTALDAMARAGAVAVVVSRVPEHADNERWLPLGRTPWRAYLLRSRATGNEAGGS
jgi:acyl-homoserine lactone acylase PvdQ